LADGLLRVRNIYNGSEQQLKVDLVVAQMQRQPVGADMVLDLRVRGYDPIVVGDALVPRRVADAIREGREAGMAIATRQTVDSQTMPTIEP
jgi:hypothetical protein